MFGNSGRLLSSGFVTRVLMISMLGLLCACGGGGGGSSGGGGGGTTPPKLTANAGADITVNMGSRIDLDPKVLVAGAASYTLTADGMEMSGSSAIDEQIVKLVWKKQEGPAFAISASSFNDGKIYFIAPNVATTTTIVFKLTLTNAAGATAQDSVTITVKHINLKPVADAGTTQDIKAGVKVNLDGSGSKDTDGSIATYNWVQKTGPQVSLTGSTSANASFLAPAVTANTDLQFELTVEDNEGATATQTVTIKLTPAEVPEVSIAFPPANGLFKGNSIAAYGSAKVTGAQILSVTLELGGTQVAATLNEDGTWRADNLTIPLGSSATLKATATDSLGRSGQASAVLGKSGILGSGQSLDNPVGIEVDSTQNKLLVLSAGSKKGSTRLFSVDLANGKRSANISSFSDLSQGPTDEALISTAYDVTGKKFYATGAPADLTISPYVIGIDAATGQRTLISSNTKGTGAALDLPYGIAFANNSLYVADNLTSKILKIDPLTGNRTTIADKDTSFYSIDAPALLTADQRGQNPLLFMMPNATMGFVLGLTTNTDTSLSDLITDSSESGSGPSIINLPNSLVADESTNKLYVLAHFGELIEVDMLTGKRKQLGSFTGADKMTYDAAKRVIYIVAGFPLSVWSVDPATGTAVVLSNDIDF